jgi:hypothetical protein
MQITAAHSEAAKQTDSSTITQASDQKFLPHVRTDPSASTRCYESKPQTNSDACTQQRREAKIATLSKYSI